VSDGFYRAAILLLRLAGEVMMGHDAAQRRDVRTGLCL
jgi:hypothetical protein